MWAERGGAFVHDGLKALGVAHGVTTRALGSMKLEENRRAALAAAGADPELLRVSNQVHGKRVVRWEDAGPRRSDADAMTAERPGAALGVYIADCQPLFVWEKTGHAVAVAHMGWRGTALGMAKALIEALIQRGYDPRDLKAAVGPHIRSCCYEVGSDVAAKFPAACRKVPAGGKPGREFLELSASTRLQLLEAGMTDASIDTDSPCTHCHPELFYSFRREKADLRMLAFIVQP